jgi:hypothetical protein
LTQTPTQTPFKKCGSCRVVWADWKSFVDDPAVRLLGLQVVPGMPHANVLVFEHGCGSSISSLTSRLHHLVSEEDPADNLPRLFGTDTCEGHCRSIADLEACDRPCGNARDRRLAIHISDMKKAASGRRS